MRTLVVAASLVGTFVVGCGMGWDAYADEPLRRRIAGLTAEEVADAVIEAEICPREPLALSPENVSTLLKRIGGLAATPDIGKREPWKMLRLVTLRTVRGETFEIEVAMRPSLGSLPIVILEEKPSGGMGFYYGDTFWTWLEDTSESKALAKRLEDMPCTS